VDSIGEKEEVEPPEDNRDYGRHFDPTQCLFCNRDSSDLEENLSHMQKYHGLFIPSPESLVVDIETLLDYFHLVIFDYAECLYCGSARRSPQAAQQHMIGKGHCRIDLTREDSEFLDFYDFGLNCEEETDADAAGKKKVGLFVGLDDTTRRLASGRILSHRSVKKTQAHRTATHTNEDKTNNLRLKEQGSVFSNTSKAMVASASNKEIGAAKRELVFSKQLACLRAEDRRALAHLTLPQQRAMMAKAKAQQEKWNRMRSALEMKVQLKSNP